MFSFLNLCEIILKGQNEILEWCKHNNLILKDIKCEICKESMKFVYIPCEQTFYWRCKKNNPVIHDKHKSVFHNSWFNGSNLNINSILILIYKFSIGETLYENLIRETSILKTTSTKTINDWLYKCREVCMSWMANYQNNKGMLGGEGKVVEIDESKVGHRKYNCGRIIDGTWVLGIIEITGNDKRQGGDFRIFIIPDNNRNAENLISIILNNVMPKTTIITDLWKAYNNLESLGFKHLTVNHKVNFVDPETYANTQTIESNWRAMKSSLNGRGIKKDFLAYHLCEFLWRRQMKIQNKDLFLGFIEAISQIHNPNISKNIF